MLRSICTRAQWLANPRFTTVVELEVFRLGIDCSCMRRASRDRSPGRYRSPHTIVLDGVRQKRAPVSGAESIASGPLGGMDAWRQACSWLRQGLAPLRRRSRSRFLPLVAIAIVVGGDVSFPRRRPRSSSRRQTRGHRSNLPIRIDGHASLRQRTRASFFKTVHAGRQTLIRAPRRPVSSGNVLFASTHEESLGGSDLPPQLA